MRPTTADLVLVTSAERPDLRPEMLALGDSPWPEFLNHDAVTNELWPLLHDLAPDYQFALLDAATDEIAAIGNCIPIRWDGDPASLPDDGIDAVLQDGTSLLREGAAPTAASALMFVVEPKWLGMGISGRALAAMAQVVGRHGLRDLVAPVRPTGTVAQWENWTGMALPASGSYVVKGGLVPVLIDRGRDIGEYVEPPAGFVTAHPPDRLLTGS